MAKTRLFRVLKRALAQDLSRRQFMKDLMLAGVLVSPAGALLSNCQSQRIKPLTDRGRVTIIGAGLAGLTAAYYLTEKNFSCEIYEASARVGGRVFTKPNFNSDQMIIEGGGELIDLNHVDILKLCKELNIEIENYSEIDRDLENNLYFFKNKMHSDETIIPLLKPFLEKLKIDFLKAFPTGEVTDVLNEFAQQIDQQSLEEYLETFHDVDPFVIELVKVAYMGELGLDPEKQTAIMMLMMLRYDKKTGFQIYGDSDQSLHIKGGNQKLVDALVKELTLRNVEFHFSTPLVQIKELSSKIALTFMDGSSSGKTLHAERVICTIPFSVLRNIEGVFTLGLSPKKRECIKTMAYGTNSKVFLEYRERFWHQKIQHKEAKKSFRGSNASVYSDLSFQNTWDSSRYQKGTSGIVTCYLGGSAGAQASASLYSTLRHDLGVVFPGLTQFNTENQMCMNWSKFPLTLGSYSSFKPGDYTNYLGVPAEPELNGKLLFAGEHANSDFIAFMNGACLSGRLAAETIIKA